MYTPLVRYLICAVRENPCVVVPGLGGFVTNYRPAAVDERTDYFTPPSLGVAFNARLTYNDGLLLQAVATSEGLPPTEAALRLQRYVDALRRELYSCGQADLEGLGLLYLDKDHAVQFRAAARGNLLPASYGLRGFRFASVRNRRQAGATQRKEMDTNLGNRRAIAATAAAAAVAVLLLGGAIFMQRHTSQAPRPAAASMLPAGDTAPEAGAGADIGAAADTLPPAQSGAGNTAAARDGSHHELSTRKSVALQYHESYNTVEYHIIAASYATRANAERRARELEAEGFATRVLSQPGGKARVSIFASDDKYEALKQLDFLKATRDPGLWLLKHDKETAGDPGQGNAGLPR